MPIASRPRAARGPPTRVGSRESTRTGGRRHSAAAAAGDSDTLTHWPTAAAARVGAKTVGVDTLPSRARPPPPTPPTHLREHRGPQSQERWGWRPLLPSEGVRFTQPPPGPPPSVANSSLGRPHPSDVPTAAANRAPCWADATRETGTHGPGTPAAPSPQHPPLPLWRRVFSSAFPPPPANYSTSPCASRPMGGHHGQDGPAPRRSMCVATLHRVATRRGRHVERGEGAPAGVAAGGVASAAGRPYTGRPRTRITARVGGGGGHRRRVAQKTQDPPKKCADREQTKSSGKEPEGAAASSTPPRRLGPPRPRSQPPHRVVGCRRRASTKRGIRGAWRRRRDPRGKSISAIGGPHERGVQQERIPL